MKRYMIIGLLVIALAGITACASPQKPWADWTPKEKSTFMNATYNQQYDDYLIVSKSPNLTEDQKEILRTKKKVFVEIWPLLKTYSQYAQGGQVPTLMLEAQLMRLLNRLMYEGGF